MDGRVRADIRACYRSRRCTADDVYGTSALPSRFSKEVMQARCWASRATAVNQFTVPRKSLGAEHWVGNNSTRSGGTASASWRGRCLTTE